MSREFPTLWQMVIEDELVSIGILNGSHSDPKKALKDVIDWNVKAALDPSISEDAKKLQECFLIMKQYGRGIFRAQALPHGLFHGNRKQANACVRGLNKKAKEYTYYLATTKHIHPED